MQLNYNLNKLLILLKSEWELMQEAKEAFQYSVKSCAVYETDDKNLSMEDEDRMEAYTARFARLLDIYTQKILRTIDKIELNPQSPLKDIINRAAKNNIISDAEKLISLKLFRNEIVHEYIPSSQRKIFFEIKSYESFLLECIEITGNFIYSKYTLYKLLG